MDPDALRQVMEELIPFNKYVGVRVVEIDRGRVRLEVPFRAELIGDPIRLAIHGGVMSMLADTAGGAAVWSELEEPRARVSTIDMRIDYLRPGKQETLVCEASVVRLGRRVGVTDMRLFHPSAPVESVATGKGVYNIVVPKGATTPTWPT
jgi:uncharacterized protein (TIGR00369 family)